MISALKSRRDILKMSAHIPLIGPLIRALPKAKNVLLLLADDQNLRLGCYGDAYARTPNLDRLAKRSVRFDQAIVQFPLCNPSRTSFFTGLRPRTTKVFRNGTDPRPIVKAPMMHEWFRSQGYWTACVGKGLHFPDADRWSYFKLPSKVPRTPLLGSDPFQWAYDVRTPESDFHDVVVSEEVCKILNENRSAPFFVVAGFRMPHLPIVVPERFARLFPAAPPAAGGGGTTAIPSIALVHLGPDCTLDASQKQELTRAYYAAGAFLDAQVGVILDALERLHRWGDTIVVFASDNGFSLGERGLWGKSTLFDECTRVPFMIAAPEVGPSVETRLVELVDLFPTLVRMAGIASPGLTEGSDLSPLIADPRGLWDRPAFSELRHPIVEARGVWKRHFRYAQWTKEGKPLAEELYDREIDPREDMNRAADPAYAPVREELRALLG